MSHVTYSVPEIHCRACEDSIRRALTGTGIGPVEVDLQARTVSVAYDAGSTDETALRKAIERAGFDVEG